MDEHPIVSALAALVFAAFAILISILPYVAQWAQQILERIYE